MEDSHLCNGSQSWVKIAIKVIPILKDLVEQTGLLYKSPGSPD